MSGYTIIDADTHVTETPDLWTSRAPASMRDRVPRVETSARGTQRWVLGGVRGVLASPGMTATAGVGSFKNPPRTYEEMHPGAYDAKARLKYMDDMGIWAMVMYPNVGGFGAQQFLKLNDPELMLTCVQIYNDWQTEWASADARRLLPIASIPFWDVKAAAKEVRRCAAMGHRGILFTGEPQYFGQPLLGDPHWNPLWEAAVELDLPISFHVGSGDMTEGLLKNRVAAYGQAAAFTALAINILFQNGMQVSDLIMSGVLTRYPQIKFVSVESGIGWIPFVLEAVDHSYREGRPHRTSEWELMPSEYFRRQVYATHWFETVPLRKLLDDLPVDNLLFETDFPHPTCLYDDVAGRVEEAFRGIDAALRRKLLWGNGAALYGVADPPA
jgi:uncharacterized protein